MELDSRKLDELLELTRENNKILGGMRRSQRWKSFFTFVYWFIILCSVFGVYYYFQPTIQKYMKTFETATTVLQNVEKTAGSIPAYLQNFGNTTAK